jgi:hypothetical protein
MRGHMQNGDRVISDAELVYLAAAEFAVRVGMVRREDLKSFDTLAPIRKADCAAIGEAMRRHVLEQVFGAIYPAAQHADEQNISALGAMRQIGQQFMAALPHPRG